MATDLFYWMLNMSLAASAAGLVLLLLRSVRRIPRFAVYTLWGVVLLRFLLPVSVSNRYGLMNLIAGLTSHATVPAGGLTVTNYLMAASSYSPVAFRTASLARIFETASVVWIAGAALVWISLALAYGAAMRPMKEAERIGEGLYRSARIDTPIVVGILRPRIVVPAGLEGEALAWALRHERVHVRRRDNLNRVVALAVCGLHWFNPMVWLFLRAFLQDMESACDAGVLKGRPEAEKKAYARALLDHAMRRPGLGVPSLGGGSVRRRLDLLLSYRPVAILSMLFFVALWVAIAVALLTNPA